MASGGAAPLPSHSNDDGDVNEIFLNNMLEMGIYPQVARQVLCLVKFIHLFILISILIRDIFQGFEKCEQSKFRRGVSSGFWRSIILSI